jgi:hypothetical protein
MITKKNFYVSFLIFISFSLFSDGNIGFNYEGHWASNILNVDSSEDTTFISISRYQNENKYLIISYSTSSPRFTYVGGGYIREDGFLEISTTEGRNWLLTPGYSSQYNEALSISNLANVETFDSYYRFEEKFEVWPF